MNPGVSAAILSGGSARRLGGAAKSNIIVGGRPVISWMIDALSGLFSEIIIVTNTPSDFSVFKDIKIVPDIFTGLGPLAGIHSALDAALSEAVFVVAGDMPLIKKSLIKKQVKLYREKLPDVLVPKIGNYIEPLHAVYSKKVLPGLERYIRNKSSNAIRDFIGTISACYFEPAGRTEAAESFISINSPDDVDMIEEIIRNR